MKPPFFMCAPRTRSSILFECASFYVNEKFGLINLKNHTELFLEFSRNAEFFDTKIGKKDVGEIYPIVHPSGEMHIHFIYPHVFKTTKDRNDYKLQVLKTQQQKGYEYFIKGTLEIVDSLEDVVDFFKDRHFVITKRRNIVDHALSFLVAWHTRIFHARTNNKERYISILEQGVHLPIDSLIDDLEVFLEYTFKMWNAEKLLKQRGYDYTVLYYEDLEDFQSIDVALSHIFNDSGWSKCLPTDWSEHVPIKINKQYENIVLNYDEVVLTIDHIISKIDKRYLEDIV